MREDADKSKPMNADSKEKYAEQSSPLYVLHPDV